MHLRVCMYAPPPQSTPPTHSVHHTTASCAPCSRCMCVHREDEELPQVSIMCISVCVRVCVVHIYPSCMVYTPPHPLTSLHGELQVPSGCTAAVVDPLTTRGHRTLYKVTSTSDIKVRNNLKGWVVARTIAPPPPHTHPHTHL